MLEVAAKPIKQIDFVTKHKTEYCIPLWLRDEQVKLACQLPVKRMVPTPNEVRKDRIAVVCYGPSLRDNWTEIAGFDYIISCSGSHKFLVERGIIPTWHVEVDPRKHKIQLLGEPNSKTEYLPASTCHPDYFAHLMKHDANVKLWHIFDTSAEAYRVLPRGEWVVLGGNNVGLRAMALARLFGFKRQVVFGMDGNMRDTKHAGPHPLQDGTGYSEVVYEGVTYKTTPAMLESAKQTLHEIDVLIDVEFEFRGEGLVQELVKRHTRKPKNSKQGYFLALCEPELISDEYRRLNAQLHRDNLAYGVGGGRHADTIKSLAESMKTTSVLDYGCGKGYLAKELPFPIWEYDPAIPGKAEAAHPADLVVCLDVLEHIEPDKIGFVVDDLRRCTKQLGYFVIHTGASSKKLADGRNAHLIQEKREWWERQLGECFKIVRVWEKTPLLHVLVAPKSGPRPVRVVNG